MKLLKYLSVAALLSLSAGCRASGDADSISEPSSASHEAVQPTFPSGFYYSKPKADIRDTAVAKH
jgi:hypothetical protein